MRLVMVGVDYTSAGMDTREHFTMPVDAQTAVLARIAESGVAGCAMIATCNRTELYISHTSDVPPDGVLLLCNALSIPVDTYRGFFVERSERQAVVHLMRVASGLESIVPGDDQIVTQVRSAMEIAREAGTGDAMLESLFRLAVTAGKRVRTLEPFRKNISIASHAVDAAEKHCGSLAGKRALVIGNGTIGRLAAAGLAERACDVRMTIRNPNAAIEPPPGCKLVAFSSRYSEIAECDIVVSATSSPHFTVELPEVVAISRPSLWIDLAIPRDIDPAIGELDNTVLWNVDSFRSHDAERTNAHRHNAVQAIIDEEAGLFELWRKNRLRRAPAPGGTPDFPLFVSLHGATVLVAGGGAVAARRIGKLLHFGATIRLVSPRLSPEVQSYLDRREVEWIAEKYQPHHMDGVTLAIAATDSREANQRVGQDAKGRGILVSVADKRDECTFYFPAIAASDRLTAGIVSNNSDHGLVKRAAVHIREQMEQFDENDTGGKQGQCAGGATGRIDHDRHQAALS